MKVLANTKRSLLVPDFIFLINSQTCNDRLGNIHSWLDWLTWLA